MSLFKKEFRITVLQAVSGIICDTLLIIEDVGSVSVTNSKNNCTRKMIDPIRL